jgi:antitoxin VapB
LTQSSVFKSNGSQAVRLPKDVALPDTVKRVDIVKLGKARLITPAGTAWDTFFDAPGAAEDFMADRDQAEQQKRDSF